MPYERKIILNGSCANDEECSDIKHAKCSKDKLCVCITNNIRVNETYCAPALRAFCWKGEKCATDNASCINNECQCNGNSVQQSTDQCLPKLLGSSCETNSDCERVKFSKCSATKTCICSLNTLPINGASCVPILNDFCQTNDDCKVENSECIKNVCKCKVMFKTIANTECKEPHVGMACSGYLDCHDFIVHSFCSKNMKCTCKNDHVAINDKTCAPAMNVTCRDNEICAPENSICTNNICQCEPDYVYRGTNCVPEFLGMPCKTEKDCQETRFSTCSDDNVCVCKSDYIESGSSTCLPLIGGRCIHHENCVVKNSHCSSNECKCIHNYVAHSNDVCTPLILGGSCDNDEDCGDIKHSKCSKDKLCTCISSYIWVNKTYCAPALGSYCWKDEKCATDHASCIDNECKCNENSIQQSNQCSPKLLGSSCISHSDCRRVKFAKCSADKRCICLPNSRAVDRTSCVPFLNGFCLTELDCLVSNSECFDLNCECKSNFLTVSNTECREPRLGMTCSGFSDCDNLIFHSICSKNKTCTCAKNHYAISSKACAPGFNEACFESEPCARDNSICIDNICQCKPNYVYQGIKCVPGFLEMPCQTESDCQRIKFSTCSDDGMCVCKSNYTKSNSSTCLPLIEGYCTKNDDCVALNSYCLFNKCRCIENHFAHSNDLCTPMVFDDICSEDSDCIDIGRKCSRNRRCICKENHIVLSSTKCAPLLNGYCSSNKDCYVKNSICVENRCQCDFDHFSHSNYECDPITLGKLCSADIDCKNIKNSRCSSENVCVCDVNYFAVDKFFCEPILNGFCSSDSDCYSDSFLCIDNQCQCKSNYTAVSVDKCIETNLVSSCTDVSECSDSWHSTCSLEGKCVCALNNRAFGTSICLPILNGYCWKDDQCMAESSVCINYRCHCKQNFIAVANNLCVLNN
ncbi:prion-like-(Q/N-rich) domain-bearing protein 25 [Microplitis mediator]|uniref:prion-like-(Q/N-rich) domain-bearing protein 25 n=1 Tax=Microplitis mediator TaxID=375433 RepID=UPI00255648DB|nr:prion-like-(Q/N-rich) domain-bearing protein 25 [Microplitis mediator]